MAPSKLTITTSSLRRLIKEEASYHKELSQQEARIKKLEETPEGDENAEFQLRQEVCYHILFFEILLSFSGQISLMIPKLLSYFFLRQHKLSSVYFAMNFDLPSNPMQCPSCSKSTFLTIHRYDHSVKASKRRKRCSPLCERRSQKL